MPAHNSQTKTVGTDCGDCRVPKPPELSPVHARALLVGTWDGAAVPPFQLPPRRIRLASVARNDTSRITAQRALSDELLFPQPVVGNSTPASRVAVARASTLFVSPQLFDEGGRSVERPTENELTVDGISDVASCSDSDETDRTVGSTASNVAAWDGASLGWGEDRGKEAEGGGVARRSQRQQLLRRHEARWSGDWPLPCVLRGTDLLRQVWGGSGLVARVPK
jgi:hypothetical protein